MRTIVVALASVVAAFADDEPVERIRQCDAIEIRDYGEGRTSCYGRWVNAVGDEQEEHICCGDKELPWNCGGKWRVTETIDGFAGRRFIHWTAPLLIVNPRLPLEAQAEEDWE